MSIPVRILRAAVQDRLDDLLPLKRRDLDRRDAILELGRTQMAQFGRPNLTFKAFTESIRLSPGTVKRLFADLDALLGEILRRHLMAICKATGEIPTDAPDRGPRRRAAYLAATRKPFGGFTEAHLLLLRDRHLLPPDELFTVEALRDGIATDLGGACGHKILDLLDAPHLSPAEIEFFVTQLAKTPIHAEPEPPKQVPPEPEPHPQAPPKTFYLPHKGAPKHPDDPPFLLPVRDALQCSRAGPG